VIAAALRSIVIEHKEPYRRGQIALAATAIDRGDEIG